MVSNQRLPPAPIPTLSDQQGLSQQALGTLMFVSGSEIGKVEKAQRWPSRTFAEHCDQALHADGYLVRLWDLADHDRRRATRPVLPTDLHDIRERWSAAVPGISIVSADTDLAFLRIPGGRAFNGALLPLINRPVSSSQRPEAPAPPAHGLIATHTSSFEQDNDCLVASSRSHHRQTPPRALPAPVPLAYRLDQLTGAIIWAIANLDEALTTDDAALADARHTASSYTQLDRSAASRDTAAGLTAVGEMWLGSDFCAEHILRHLDAFDTQPAFWTCEQTGEQTSVWLLFAHKYRYLRSLANRRETGQSLHRAACIPPDVVAASAEFERVLLFLALALMEAHGVEVSVCAEPAYAAMDGVVLAPHRRAIIANWVHADGLWYVDTTTHRPTLATYTTAVHHAREHSIIAAPTPAGRLQRLAGYLALNWSWLRARCGELGQAGAAGLLRPRSRLLSVAGLDDACAFVGDLPD